MQDHEIHQNQTTILQLEVENKLSLNDRQSKLSKTNEDKESKSSDGFKEIEIFTFAKQTPKIK